MQISKIILVILAFSLANFAYAQKSMFFGAKMTIVEDAVEAYRVIPVVTADNTVVEIRVSECEGCAVKIYGPSENMEFFAGSKKVEALTAAKISKDNAAIVFIDTVTKNVRSVSYGLTNVDGESL